ncbi:DUF6241 domain-containing protein [Halobacillus litoralis]|uniref:DUF6241 domain-containing protein n=1 Tax=Halobacillus litoralis TaxID=45668 RepID=UPI0013705955|nr:DUF6241 domain-containing protein [Halobacillus litoralis]MYL36391.1 hypothetical protein [Halobacillus litoralis]
MGEGILKWSLYVLGALSLLIIGGITWVVVSGFQADSGSLTEEQEQKMEEVNEPEEQKAIKKVDEDGIPSEQFFMQELHEMTHQKVRAEEKHGRQQMTADQIDQMLGILKSIEGTETYYKHYDFYKKTLESWDSGDFSNAVIVHNTIWDWQNGSIGRATGLMSEDEEREYIEQNF